MKTRQQTPIPSQNTQPPSAPAQPSGTIPFRQYQRALRWILPYRRTLSLVLLLGLLSTALGLAQPYISRLLIDDALIRHNMHALELIAVLMVVVTIFSTIVSIASSYLYIRFSAQSLFDMRLAVYRHLQTLSPRFFAHRKLGDIVSRLNNDVGEVQRILSDTLLSVLSNVLFLIGSLAIMLWLNWRLTLASLALLPIGALALRHFQARLAQQTRVLRESSATLGSFLIESLMGIRLVVATGSEQRESDRFRAHNNSFIQALLRMQFLSFLASAAPGTVLTLSTAIVFVYGGRMVVQNHLTIGGLVAFMAYHMRLLSPVQTMLGMYTNLLAGGISLERVFSLLDIAPEVKESANAQPFGGLRNELCLAQVSFSYTPDKPILRDTTLRIPHGSLTVILGPSGAGKSTLADLLIRFYDPDQGTITLDGTDLRHLRIADLRREIALVEQLPFFFHASIRENISYARPESTDEEIRAAARSAQIEQFIESLPEKYGTMLGERGATISVGERQRIALARALLRNPSLIVLDEPTSALDAQSEAAVAHELAQVLKGRTAILITHRTSLLEIADQVLVLENGVIREQAIVESYS